MQTQHTCCFPVLDPELWGAVITALTVPQTFTVTAIPAIVAEVECGERVPAARGRLADLTVASVPGLTTQVSTTVPSTLRWQWADALHAVGRGGMLSTARFGRDEAIALFGAAGVPTHAPAATRSAAVTHLGALPGEFLVGVGDVGTIEQLERAEGPSPAPRRTLTGWPISRQPSS